RLEPRVKQILTGDGVAGYVADVLAAAWQALLEPEWRTLRAILERGGGYRAGQLASKGWGAALTDPHPRPGRRPGRVQVRRWAGGGGGRGRGGGGGAGFPPPGLSSGPAPRPAWPRRGRRP